MVLGQDLHPPPIVIPIVTNQADLSSRDRIQHPFFVVSVKLVNAGDRSNPCAVFQTLQGTDAVKIKPGPVDDLLPKPSRVQIGGRPLNDGRSSGKNGPMHWPTACPRWSAETTVPAPNRPMALRPQEHRILAHHINVVNGIGADGDVLANGLDQFAYPLELQVDLNALPGLILGNGSGSPSCLGRSSPEYSLKDVLQFSHWQIP